MANAKKGQFITCRRCELEYEAKEFPPSYSFANEKTKKLSICRNCCSELYDRLLVEYQDEMKALYRFCMILDFPFSKKLATSLQSNKNSGNNIGYQYINKLGLVQYRNKTFQNDMEFINIFGISDEDLEDILMVNVEKTKEKAIEEAKSVITPEVVGRWGKDMAVEEYTFLEDRYKIMLETYDISNPSTVWDMQELCMLYLELRKNRGNPNAQKNTQDMIDKIQSRCKMKLTQIDTTEDDSACFGRFIDKIENYEPCEKKLPFFEDIDGIGKYIKKWFTKPFAMEWGLSDKIERQEKEIIEEENDNDE